MVVRFNKPGCSVCGPSTFDTSYTDFVPTPHAFPFDEPATSNGRVSAASVGGKTDLEELVRVITEQVMAALEGATV